MARPPTIIVILLVFLAAYSSPALTAPAEDDLAGVVVSGAAEVGAAVRAFFQQQLGLHDHPSSSRSSSPSLSTTPSPPPPSWMQQPSTSLPISDKRATAELADRLARRIAAVSAVLEDTKRAIEDAYAGNHKVLDTHEASHPPVPSCCEVGQGLLRYDDHYGVPVNEAFACRVDGGNGGAELAANVSAAFRSLQVVSPHSSQNDAAGDVKWRFLLGSAGLHLEYPSAQSGCGLSSRHRDAYFAAVRAGGRRNNIVVVFDRGNSVDGHMLDTARSVVHYVLSSVTPMDRIGFVAAAEGVYFPLGADCPVQSMSPATSEVRMELLKFINVVQPSKVPTDHAGALRAVQEIVRNSDLGVSPDPHPVRVLYISSGQTASPGDAEEALSVVDFMRKQMSHVEVSVNAYMLKPEQSSDDTGGEDFLRGLTEQSGAFVRLDRPEDVGDDVGDFLKPPTAADANENNVILPSWDDIGHGLVFTLASVFRTGDDEASGVVGMDVPAFNLLEDLVLHNAHSAADAVSSSYACLLERVGMDLRVIYHPRTYDSKNPVVPEVMLEQVEDFPADQDISGYLVTLPFGSRSVDGGEREFTWKWVDGSQYVVMNVNVRSTSPPSLTSGQLTSEFLTPASSGDVLPARLYYHRLDLLPNVDRPGLLCLNDGDVLSMVEAATLYLSPSAFSSPHRMADDDDVSASIASSFMTFLNDRTFLISNPGLNAGVRGDVAYISKMVAAWKKADAVSSGDRAVIERFAATTTGVQINLPGTRLPDDYDFFSRRWFSLALHQSGVAVTGPALHPSGLGFAVTLSAAVGQGRKTVVGASVPVGAMAKFLADAMPENCGSGADSTTCFLIDQTGNLVYHPLMTDPTYGGPVEDQHLNHKEPNIGKDLLINFSGDLVTKTFCKSFHDDSVWRRYSFDAAANATYSGSVHGSDGRNNCSRYSLAPVPGTNLLLGVVRNECPVAAVFCPCGINSRRCIVCEQARQDAVKSCECPCQCPLQLGAPVCPVANMRSPGRDETKSMRPDELPVCPPRLTPVSDGLVDSSFQVSGASRQTGAHLPSCFVSPPSCSYIVAKEACLSVVGCSWCEYEMVADPDYSPAFVPLDSPRCDLRQVCHRGAVGLPSPYMGRLGSGGAAGRRAGGEKYLSVSTAGGADGDRPSPVGPVVGGILVFFLFLVFSVFCYRQKVSDADGSCAPRLLRGAAPGHGRRAMSNIEVDEEEELREMQQALPVATTAEEAIMSPYRMNPGFSRPPPDSDCGYSTMTGPTVGGGGGDADSEVIMPYTASAPARERLLHRQHVPASLQSVTSGVSSRATSPAPSSVAVFQRRQKQKQAESSSAEDDPSQVPEITLSRLQQQTRLPPSCGMGPAAAADGTSSQQQIELKPNQIVVAATVHKVDELQ